MLAFLSAFENIAFAAALALMLLIGLVEAVGLGVGSADFDVGSAHDGLLTWLGVGRVPLLILLVAFLASFGLIGLAGQQIMLAATGSLLPGMIAIPAATAAALPATSALSRLLSRIMPRDETSAIPIDSLVGLVGTIVIGRAARGSPAKAQVRDPYGQAHYVMAEPDNPDQVFNQGDSVLLVRRQANVFRAIAHDDHRISNWTIEP